MTRKIITLEELLLKVELTQPLKILTMDRTDESDKDILFNGCLLDLLATKDNPLLKANLHRLKVEQDTIIIYI